MKVVLCGLVHVCLHIVVTNNQTIKKKRSQPGAISVIKEIKKLQINLFANIDVIITCETRKGWM